MADADLIVDLCTSERETPDHVHQNSTVDDSEAMASTIVGVGASAKTSELPVVNTTPEDNSDYVDISMWTHHGSSPDSSRRIKRAHTNSNSPLLMQIPDQSNIDVRSDTPDSGEEIPFQASSESQPNDRQHPSNSAVTGETITVISSNKTPLSDRKPQAIKFLEGSAHLQILPQYLYDQLKQYCQVKATDYPDIIKQKWPAPNSVYQTKNGNRTWFELPQNGERLLAARFQYGKLGQFIVVEQESGYTFNSGRAAIVTHCSASTAPPKKNGLIQSCYQWKVWDPFAELAMPLLVWRIIEARGTTHYNPGPTTIKSKLLMPDDNSSSKVSKSKTDSSSSRESDAFDQIQGLKRTHVSENASGSTKKQRMKTVSIDPKLLKDSYPIIGSVGARRDRATGEIILRRKSDGMLVVLRCPKCNYNNNDTQQGLYNHMNTFHKNRFTNHDELADVCGIVIEGVPASASSVASPPQKQLPLPVVPPSRTQPSRRVSQRLNTPPGSTEPLETDHNNLKESRVIFKKSHDDPNPRVRPLSAINTAEKLFVNAIVAGIARRDTLMLTITIADETSMHVVKNDKEDYETILKRLEDSKVEAPDVVITVEDLD